jgi:phage protein D
MSFIDSWRVEVDGVNQTEALSKYLINISVTDKEGQTADSCSMTLDDTNGSLKLPRMGARISVRFKGVLIFKGALDAPKSSGSKSSGRVLKVTAKSVANQEKAKEPQTIHGDDQTLGDFMGKLAKNAGFDLIIDDELASQFRNYWSADAKSFLAFGEQIANELNGTFKVRDDKAVLAKRGNSKAPNGGELPTIEAAYGQNLVSWNVTPAQPRPIYSQTKVRYFERSEAKVKEVVETHDDSDDKVTRMIRTLAPDKAQAKEIAKARGGEQERQKGEGSVVIEPEPSAQVEGLIKLSGCRAGVDGTYRITEITHSGSKSAGNKTQIQFKEPQGGAGIDAR